MMLTGLGGARAASGSDPCGGGGRGSRDGVQGAGEGGGCIPCAEED